MGLFGSRKKKQMQEEQAQAELEARKKKEHDDLVEQQKNAHADLTWPKLMPINGLRNKETGLAVLPAEDDPLSQEKKDEIGAMVFEPEIKPEDVQKLDNTELMFLLDTHEMYNHHAALENYEANHRVMYNELLDRIHKAKQYYVLYDSRTRYPFVDAGFAFVYFDEDHAKKAAELYQKQFRKLVPQVRPGESAEPNEQGIRPLALFDYFYYVGVEKVILDNGYYRVGIRRGEISAPPTFAADPKQIPPASPALSYAMTDFLQEVRWGVKYDKREEVLKRKQQRMNILIPSSKYVVPMLLKDDDNAPTQVGPDGKERKAKRMEFPMIMLKARKSDGTEEEQRFLPVFTDLFEFSKNFPKQEYKPAVFEYSKMLGLVRPLGGFIINPRGQNVIVPQKRGEELYNELQQLKAKAPSAKATTVTQFPGNNNPGSNNQNPTKA